MMDLLKALQDFGVSLLNISGFFILLTWNFKQMEKREERYGRLLQELVDLQSKMDQRLILIENDLKMLKSST